MDAITRPAVTIDRAGRHSSAPLDVRQITAEQHQAFVAGRPSVSFLQVPQWAAAKPDWASESVGWISVDGRIVGAALVLYRRIPRLNRSLAYLPEGPVIDWGAPDLSRWLEPLVEHLRARGVFTVRIGPPVQRRWWETPTIRSAIAGGSAVRLGDVAPDGVGASAADVTSQLRAMGWRQAPGYRDGDGDGDGDGRHGSGAGFAGGQPRYVFQVPIGGRSITEVFAGLGQQWRRNIRTSERLDVEVTAGGRDDFDVFHDLYVTTAARDGFTPRPRRYFPQMWDALHTDFSPAVAARPSRFTTVRGGREAGGAAGGASGGAAGNTMGDTASGAAGNSGSGAVGGAAGNTSGGPAGNTMGDTASSTIGDTASGAASSRGGGAAGDTGGPAGDTSGGRPGDTSGGAARDLVAASDGTSTGGSVGIPVGAPADASAGGPGRPDMRLYLARHRGAVLAASILVRVGDHAWYSYGASADHDRRLKPSNALQWRMLADAHAAGAAVYDLRGIGASLDADDALFGLTRFKLGSGGRAVELLGEWELPINRLLHRAVGAYLARR